jgi:hypothetical protein
LDSSQIREVARLSVHEKVKDSIIIYQDSLIMDLKEHQVNSDSIQVKQDSIISNQETIIKNKEQNIKGVQNICNIEKKKLKKTKRNLIFVIISQSILILSVLFIK